MGLCSIQPKHPYTGANIVKQFYVVEIQYICLNFNYFLNNSRSNFFADTFYFGISVIAIKTTTDWTATMYLALF